MAAATASPFLDTQIPDCLSARISRIGSHIDRAEWFSGLDLARRTLNCAQAHGCPLCDDCQCGAQLLLEEIRTRLG